MTHATSTCRETTKPSTSRASHARLDRSHRQDALLDGVMSSYIRDIAGRPGSSERHRGASAVAAYGAGR